MPSVDENAHGDVDADDDGALDVTYGGAAGMDEAVPAVAVDHNESDVIMSLISITDNIFHCVIHTTIPNMSNINSTILIRINTTIGIIINLTLILPCSTNISALPPTDTAFPGCTRLSDAPSSELTARTPDPRWLPGERPGLCLSVVVQIVKSYQETTM